MTPLDALLAINELTERAFSDPSSGELISITDPLDRPRFLDVNNDGRISPLDPLGVINELNRNVPAAALSSSTWGLQSTAQSQDAEDEHPRLLTNAIDLAFQQLAANPRL